MGKIVLISCVSKKLPYKTKAKDLYVSPLFRMNLQYAQQLNPSFIFILSAKYGLVPLDKEIEPYDITLNKLSAVERRSWASTVLSQLRENCDINNDHVVVLAGKKYRQYLIPHLKYYEIPMQGLTIGKQLQFLKKQITNE